MIIRTTSKHLLFILLLLNILFIGQSDVFNHTVYAEEEIQCEDILEIQSKLLDELKSSSIEFQEYNKKMNEKLDECINSNFEDLLLEQYGSIENFENLQNNTNLGIFDYINQQNRPLQQLHSVQSQTKKILSFNMTNNLIEQTIYNEFLTQLSELKDTTDKIKKAITKAKNTHSGKDKKVPNQNQTQCL